ncbi:FAD/NAD(P)-binding protein [Jeotgalibacillus marinus]|uniref:FAD/NAD(P)-binding protein n=1 Tax=Jeotgalibacillus marinus TaxID=86667 RepID=A0ABV3Q7P0_9BACL
MILVNSVIVGVGPLGLSVFKRVCVNTERRNQYAINRKQVHIDFIDPFPPQGSVWRKSHSPELIMNTVTSQF